MGHLEPFQVIWRHTDSLDEVNLSGVGGLTTSEGGRIVGAISGWYVYEGTGFHLGNPG